MTERHEIDLPGDPSGIEGPHDILAAEEFAMPARSAGDIPRDPTGIEGPHDVLAAEEFAMPTAGVESGPATFDPRTLIPGLLLATGLLLLFRHLLRRR